MNSIMRAARLLALVAVALTALAHHSFNAEFDEKATIKLTGPVTKVEWFNPHIWVYLDVKDAEGKLENADSQYDKRGENVRLNEPMV